MRISTGLPHENANARTAVLAVLSGED